MGRDTVGNSMGQAKALKLGANQRENVGSSDREDFYRFSLTRASSLKVNFRSTRTNASLDLIQDRNSNGLIDADEIISSAKAGRLSKSANVLSLVEGTYFLRVSSRGAGQVDYQLKLSTQTLPAGNTSNPNPQAPSPLNQFVNQVVQLTNIFRQQNGLSALRVNDKLNTAAQTQSQNMALQDFFNHIGLDGSHPWDRMTAAGYQWSWAAENIAAGQITPQEVVDAWINSPGHRANMLNPNVTEIGVGYYNLQNDTGSVNYNSYWTQVFGAPL